jgi:transmembrane sensor
MTNDELLHKWVNGQLSAAEKKEFEQRPEYESLVALYRQTEGMSPPHLDSETMLQEILATPQAKTRRMAAWIPYAVAASVLLLATWVFWVNRPLRKNYEVARGERLEGVLPDQSTFVLNAESELRYKARNWDENRKLKLTGEAFFSVQKGSRFEVETVNGFVEVLGTEFNVLSRGQHLDVSCRSGKVRVRSSDGKVEADLLPNEALRIDGGELVEKWSQAAAEQSSWMEGVSRFRNATVASVLAELERQFDLEIDPGPIDTQAKLTGFFPHDSLDLAIQTALGSLGVIAERKKDGSLILRLE